jgi:SOS-response transcriptional repressor LexA
MAFATNITPMASIGEKIKYLRTARRPSLSQLELAKEIGITRDQVSNYETDRTEPPRPIVTKLSRLWSVPEEWLWDESAGLNPPGLKNVEVTKRRNLPLVNLVPYWGEVPCGDWTRPEVHEDLIQVSEAIDVEGCVAVRVSGRSMYPRLIDGQLVVIKLSKSRKDGVITLARDQDANLTLKVLRYFQGKWELQSIDPEYGSISADMVEILGHAIHVEESNPNGIRP